MHLLWAQLNLPNKGTEPVLVATGVSQRVPRRAPMFGQSCLELLVGARHC
jgi:hypothetical protein